MLKSNIVIQVCFIPDNKSWLHSFVNINVRASDIGWNIKGRWYKLKNSVKEQKGRRQNPYILHLSKMKFLFVVTLLVCLITMSQSMFNDYGFQYFDDNGLWKRGGGRMSQFFR